MKQPYAVTNSDVIFVAPYIRVSTLEQAQEGFSIAAQKEKLNQFCLSQGWKIYDWYIDEGVSAKDIDGRPEMNRLLTDIESGKVNLVLSYRLDRLTRSVLDLYKLLDHFDKYGVGYRSSTEVFDTTTPIGRLFITLVAAIAQWERENLTERVKMGMEQMAKEGKFHGGTPPYGYVIEKEGGLEIFEPEAKIVREVFRFRLLGEGPQKIIKRLNARGIVSKLGKKWHVSGISKMLANPIYIGTLRWHVNSENLQVEDAVPAIISKETFQRAQDINSTKRVLHPRAIASDFLFSGIGRCARCGGSLSGSSSRNDPEKPRYKYYRCYNSKRGLCSLPSISEQKISSVLVGQVLRRTELVPVEESDLLLDDVSSTELNPAHEIEKLGKELEKIQKRRRVWQRLLADEEISLDDYRENIKEDSSRETEINSILVEIKKTAAPKRSREEILEALMNLEAIWELAEESERKYLLGLLVEEFTVDFDPEKRCVKIGSISFL